MIKTKDEIIKSKGFNGTDYELTVIKNCMEEYHNQFTTSLHAAKDGEWVRFIEEWSEFKLKIGDLVYAGTVGVEAIVELIARFEDRQPTLFKQPTPPKS